MCLRSYIHARTHACAIHAGTLVDILTIVVETRPRSGRARHRPWDRLRRTLRGTPCMRRRSPQNSAAKPRSLATSGHNPTLCQSARLYAVGENTSRNIASCRRHDWRRILCGLQIKSCPISPKLCQIAPGQSLTNVRKHVIEIVPNSTVSDMTSDPRCRPIWDGFGQHWPDTCLHWPRSGCGPPWSSARLSWPRSAKFGATSSTMLCESSSRTNFPRPLAQSPGYGVQNPKQIEPKLSTSAELGPDCRDLDRNRPGFGRNRSDVGRSEKRRCS